MGFEMQFRLDFAVYKTKTTSTSTQFIIYICEQILLVIDHITKIKLFKMQYLRNNTIINTLYHTLDCTQIAHFVIFVATKF